MSSRRMFAGIAAVAMLAAFPAAAQKSKDEMRVAINDMFPVIDHYVFPQDEAAIWYRMLYSPLITFYEHAQKFIPAIAKSWKEVKPGVFEFDLREDVVFSSGNKLTADDVVYTINLFADPKSKIRFKTRYDWMEPVEKLGPYKVRIKSKNPSPGDLSTLAYRSKIYDKTVHEKLEKYEDYGRVSGSGTGVAP